MKKPSEQMMASAFIELQKELKEFSHDGLVKLEEDLSARNVMRGSWAGCVISYKRGAPGSCRRDRVGRIRNHFTILWDNGWIGEEEVLQAVRDELASRPQPAVLV